MAGVVGRCLRHKITFVPVRAVHAPSAGEHSGGIKVWKNLSIFVALPAVGLCMVNAYLKHQEEHHHPRAEFIAYEHLRIRNKGVSRLVDITAGGDFLGLRDQKSSYKRVSDFGRLWSYGRLKLRIEGNDY